MRRNAEIIQISVPTGNLHHVHEKVKSETCCVLFFVNMLLGNKVSKLIIMYKNKNTLSIIKKNKLFQKKPFSFRILYGIIHSAVVMH